MRYEDPKVIAAENLAKSIAEQIKSKASDAGVRDEIVRRVNGYAHSIRGQMFSAYTGHVEISAEVLRGAQECRRTWTSGIRRVDDPKPIPVDKIVELLVEREKHEQAKAKRAAESSARFQAGIAAEKRLRAKHPSTGFLAFYKAEVGLVIKITGLTEAKADAILTTLDSMEEQG